jgi:hypothetical protein
VTGNDAGKGTLVAALAEAAFLIGLERNRLAVLYPFFLILEFCHTTISQICVAGGCQN